MVAAVIAAGGEGVTDYTTAGGDWNKGMCLSGAAQSPIRIGTEG
jgi:hypothetical protein